MAAFLVWTGVISDDSVVEFTLPLGCSEQAAPPVARVVKGAADQLRINGTTNNDTIYVAPAPTTAFLIIAAMSSMA